MIQLYSKQDYCIISATSLEELTEEVQAKVNEGWKVSGGVAPGVDSSQGVFIQAMTK